MFLIYLCSTPERIETVFGNPYAASSEEGRVTYPEGFMDVSVDSLNLDSIRYPPDTVGDAMLTDASDSLPPVMLPEPLQPDVLPAGMELKL